MSFQKQSEVRGSKRIAHELGVSTRTLNRMVAAGKLPGAAKLNGRTSPLRIERATLDRLRGKKD